MKLVLTKSDYSKGLFMGAFVHVLSESLLDDFPPKVGLMEISRLNETKRPDVAILCKILN